jgi:hypothetical protein
MFWRSVGSSQNAFAVESFIDEMAHPGGLLQNAKSLTRLSRHLLCTVIDRS